MTLIGEEMLSSGIAADNAKALTYVDTSMICHR